MKHFNLSVIKWVSIFLLCIGSTLLIAAKRSLSPNRWSPVKGPLPGPGLEVVLPFTLEAPGDYAFDISTPITEHPDAVALPPLPPLSCHLRVTISNSKGWEASKEIESLHHMARYYYGHLDYYRAELFSIPRSGDYVLKVVGIDAAPLLKSGAMFELTRNANPEDIMTIAGFGMAVGECMIGGGAVGLLIFALTRRQKHANYKSANQ